VPRQARSFGAQAGSKLRAKYGKGKLRGSTNTFQKDPYSDVAQNTEVYVHSVLQTFDAFERGFHPGVPDMSLRPTYRWQSKITVNLGTALNAFGTTYDLFFMVANSGIRHYYNSTAFAAGTGLVSATANTSDPSYTNWATSFDAVRMVACQCRVRNESPVTAEAGIAVQGMMTFGNNASYTFQQLSEEAESITRTLSNPGDVGVLTWVPVSGAFTDDTEFYAPATLPINSSSVAYIWIQTPVSGQLFSFEVVTMWEGLVVPIQESFLTPSVVLNDPMVAQMKMFQALENQPLYSQGRTVIRDDGPIDAIFRDINSIWGGIKSVLNLGGTIKSLITGGLGSLFGSEEKIFRVLCTLTDKETQYLFDEAKQSNSIEDFRAFVLAAYLDKISTDEVRFKRFKNRTVAIAFNPHFVHTKSVGPPDDSKLGDPFSPRTSGNRSKTLQASTAVKAALHASNNV